MSTLQQPRPWSIVNGSRLLLVVLLQSPNVIGSSLRRSDKFFWRMDSNWDEGSETTSVLWIGCCWYCIRLHLEMVVDIVIGLYDGQWCGLCCYRTVKGCSSLLYQCCRQLKTLKTRESIHSIISQPIERVSLSIGYLSLLFMSFSVSNQRNNYWLHKSYITYNQ